MQKIKPLTRVELKSIKHLKPSKFDTNWEVCIPIENPSRMPEINELISSLCLLAELGFVTARLGCPSAPVKGNPSGLVLVRYDPSLKPQYVYKGNKIITADGAEITIKKDGTFAFKNYKGKLVPFAGIPVKDAVKEAEKKRVFNQYHFLWTDAGARKLGKVAGARVKYDEREYLTQTFKDRGGVEHRYVYANRRAKPTVKK